MSGFGWWLTGWVGLLVSLMLWAHVMAGDQMALLATVWRAARGLAFRPVAGHFYQFKGHHIRVVDDEVEAQRWLALDDLATALGARVPASRLRLRWPQGLRELPDGIYLLDDAALAWLSEQRNDDAGRLRHWVEREVWYPARGRKASYKAKGAPQGTPED